MCGRVVWTWSEDTKCGVERDGRDGMRPVRGKRSWQGRRLTGKNNVALWPLGDAVPDASCIL
jgi:hypothetical protein